MLCEYSKPILFKLAMRISQKGAWCPTRKYV